MPAKTKKKAAKPTSVIPVPSRPRMPAGYSPKGAKAKFLPWEWAVGRLEKSHNYWICTTRPDGRPHAMPVWGVWVDGSLVFSTDPESRKARNLAANPSITVHLESGDEVVILEGTVENIKLDSAIDDAYNQKYKMRLSKFPVPFVLLKLKPKVAMAWQEKDFVTSATRWQFT
jgi:general stress protein 26